MYHRRHSEEVIGVLGATRLPEKGTAEYYSAWAAYDQCRHPSSSHRDLPAVTFAAGGDITENIINLASCRQVETGNFLNVTSLLSSQGLVRNSFSMCFAPNGYGRIAFGDKGDDDQIFTPLLPTFDQSPYYNIQIEHISVENVVINISLVVLFDSGTTLTYLTGEAYTLITKILGEQIYRLGIVKNEINTLNIIGRKSRSNGNSSLRMAIVASTVSLGGIILAVAIVCLLRLKLLAKREYEMQPLSAADPIGISNMSSQYDFDTIKVITNNFACEIGSGGFGCVYKGKLPTGEEVDVKRLSETSQQWVEEFINEVKS
ncbi:unnamed protein product [Cuscuta campestris]|uniref:Peptidase A1 domain-containing protein n=1 Tax=Cuscuta campestris TaxID=132261 RepID=A0A484L097_9ASTE|nr:unnamed protein product [Cuscuta campestris]